MDLPWIYHRFTIDLPVDLAVLSGMAMATMACRRLAVSAVTSASLSVIWENLVMEI